MAPFTLPRPSVQCSRSVVANSETPRTSARQASLSITNSRSPHKPMSIESVMPSNHFILCRPLLLPPSVFPPSVQFSSVQLLSHVQLFATPWTVAYQAPPSMGFSRQVYWSGLPFLSPEDLPNPGIEPGSPALQTDALPYHMVFVSLLTYFT